ncbi:radical SAM protein [Lacrimispora sp. BS-2]|uniref:Radical SAM protein n=1 Tax=Lacrimispora sp. BS-2 TaxID=3151850 RepID=A0AAU7PMT0_9FIRM
MRDTLKELKSNKFFVDNYHFSHNGINILLDVNNSDFYSVEDVYCDIADYLSDAGTTAEEIQDKYENKQIQEALENLKTFGFICEEEPKYKEIAIEQDKEVINLVVNVSHNCNLRCRYCFAASGSYNGERDIMSQEMADKTLNWFVNQAKTSKVLNINLFGGEPLTNIPLVKYMVKRCKELEVEYDKKIYIVISTNGTILNDELVQLIKENDIGLQISIDGDKEIHDANRPAANGQSSYDMLEKNVKVLLNEVDNSGLIPRATVAKGITDVTRIVNHMLDDLHFKCVALTPALGSYEETSYRQEDLDEYFKKYDVLAETFLEKLRNGEEYNIYPFVSEVDAVSKGIRRIYGCGSGLGFASVDIKGNIYPCMRFIGNEDYIIGHVKTSFNDKRHMFFDRTVYNRTKCKDCWARHLCGGACVAIQVECGETLQSSNPMVCQVAKRMAELAMYASSVIAKENLDFDMHKLTVNDFIRRRFS